MEVRVRNRTGNQVGLTGLGVIPAHGEKTFSAIPSTIIDREATSWQRMVDQGLVKIDVLAASSDVAEQAVSGGVEILRFDNDFDQSPYPLTLDYEETVIVYVKDNGNTAFTIPAGQHVGQRKRVALASSYDGVYLTTRIPGDDQTDALIGYYNNSGGFNTDGIDLNDSGSFADLVWDGTYWICAGFGLETYFD